MRILLLSTLDRGGGAEKVAFDLQQVYRQRGHEARMLVKYKFARSEDTFEIDPYAYTSSWGPYWARLEKSVRRLPKFRGQYHLVDWLRRTAWPKRWLDSWQGLEDFNYPYSHHLVNIGGWRPDVIHAHNLHGDYFDLRALPSLSRQVPVVWTLHDTWALTGHCVHFLDCRGWHTGCGDCQDLRRPPALRRDGTAKNWQLKSLVYADSQIAVATPSRWLMELVKQSMLQPWQRRVIPNGVDLTIYKPGDRGQARHALQLPQSARIVLLIAHNRYKDLNSMEAALGRINLDMKDELLFLCMGRNGTERSLGKGNIHYLGFEPDPQRMSLYYQASDIYLHAAHAEVFGKTITEAMACALPVVATDVGGISEQIIEGKTGFLVPWGDIELMAQRINKLIEYSDLCRMIGMAAAAYAKRAFNLKWQGEAYLQWFHELAGAYNQEPEKQ